MPNSSQIPLQLASCPATQIGDLAPWAEQYYLEDKIAFDAARFSGAINGAIALGIGSAWWLAIDGVRVGYALMMDSWSIEFGGLACVLDEIYVAPAWRGQGIASQAINALREQFRARGGVMMCMETTPDNLSAQKLYQRLGFAETRRPVFRVLLSAAL